jgi:hypothetical protein
MPQPLRAFVPKLVPTDAMCAGLIRQHQFYKVEMVQNHTPERPTQALEEITHQARRPSSGSGAPVSRRSAFHGRHGIFQFPKRSISRYGSPRKTAIARFPVAPTARIFQARRRAYATVPMLERSPNWRKRSMAAVWLWDARFWPFWKTDSKRRNRRSSKSPSSYFGWKGTHHPQGIE